MSQRRYGLKRRVPIVGIPAPKGALRQATARARAVTAARSGYLAQAVSEVLSQKELKFFDTAHSFSIDNTGEVPATGQLNLIPQGVTESTRVGRKCVIKSIQTRLAITQVPGAAAASAVNGYLLLVLDKQANGAAASVTDVMTGNNLGTAMINMSNSERFVVLKRFKWSFNATAGVTTAYNNTAKNLDFYKKCNIPLEFSSTAGAITELKSNNLFLLAGTDGAGDDTIGVNGTTRLRFSDS